MYSRQFVDVLVASTSDGLASGARSQTAIQVLLLPQWRCVWGREHGIFIFTNSFTPPPLRISLVSFVVSLDIPFPPRPSTCWMSSRQSDTSF